MKTRWFLLCAVFTFLAVHNVQAQSAGTKKFAVTFLQIPGSGGGPDITKIVSGKAEGIGVNSLLVVVYAKAGGKWWVQPTTDSPFTKIEGGQWQNETHLGLQYAALLVTKDFKPSNTLNTLPQPDAKVKAIAVVNAAK